MTEAMPFLQKYDITFLRPPTIQHGLLCVHWTPSVLNLAKYNVAR